MVKAISSWCLVVGSSLAIANFMRDTATQIDLVSAYFDYTNPEKIKPCLNNAVRDSQRAYQYVTETKIRSFYKIIS